MEIISTTGASTIEVIPRLEKAYVSVIYTNVSTDKIVRTLNRDAVYTDNALSFIVTAQDKIDIDVKEGTFVNIEIYGADSLVANPDKLMYRGRMFVTDQTINQVADDTYSINENTYTETESQNDYIIL